MKIFLWISGSLFVILIGFIAGIFLAPLLASLTSLYVCIIPLVIAGLSLIAFIGLHLIYKKARRTSNQSSFYYPGLLIPIFLCSVLITIHSADKFNDSTYDRHGIIRWRGSYYNRLGIKLFRSYASYFYAYDTYGNIYICCSEDDPFREKVEYKIYTIEGILTKSGEFNSCDENNRRKKIARSMDLIPE